MIKLLWAVSVRILSYLNMQLDVTINTMIQYAHRTSDDIWESRMLNEDVIQLPGGPLGELSLSDRLRF